MTMNWGKLEGASALITGATGLIGRLLVDILLKRKREYGQHIEIYALSRCGGLNEEGVYEWIQSVDSPFPDVHVDFIIHAAGDNSPKQFLNNPINVFNTAVMGTANLLEWSKNSKLSGFVFVSSGEVYGRVPVESGPIKEDMIGILDPMALRSCYPEGKRAAENICACYAAQYDVPVCVIRPCHLFGPTMRRDDDKVIAQFIRMAISGDPIEIYGNGLQRRSYCYGDDAVSGIFTALLSGKSGEAYNIAHPQNAVSLKELAYMIMAASGREDTPTILGRQEPHGSGITHAVLDSSKLISMGWNPVVSLTDGLKRQINAWSD